MSVKIIKHVLTAVTKQFPPDEGACHAFILNDEGEIELLIRANGTFYPVVLLKEDMSLGGRALSQAIIQVVQPVIESESVSM